MPTSVICWQPGSTSAFCGARLTWDSPASLLEKIITYEAVHEIRSWQDLHTVWTATGAAMPSSTRRCPTSR